MGESEGKARRGMGRAEAGVRKHGKAASMMPQSKAPPLAARGLGERRSPSFRREVFGIRTGRATWSATSWMSLLLLLLVIPSGRGQPPAPRRAGTPEPVPCAAPG